MLCYVILNKKNGCLLLYSDGSIVHRSTIKDCYEYLWYVLDLEDTSDYEIINTVLPIA